MTKKVVWRACKLVQLEMDDEGIWPHVAPPGL